MNSALRFCIRKVTCNFIKNYSLEREGRILQKMIKKGLQNKKPISHGNKVITKRFFPLNYEIEDCSRRMVAINKIYMECITEMINNGKFGRELSDLDIDVTEVQISKCFNFLNIYFISRNPDNKDEDIKEILNKALAELQMKMGDIKYIPKVPYLKFVRNARLENEVQMEKIFQVADFGRGFKPVNDKKVVTQHSSEKPDGLPKMRQDVLGVDVTRIKETISADIKRFKLINTGAPENDRYHEYETPSKLIKFNKKDFYKFIKRRRIEELKRRKHEERKLGEFYHDIDYQPYSIFENEYEFVDDKFADENDEGENNDGIADENDEDENNDGIADENDENESNDEVDDVNDENESDKEMQNR